MTVSALILAGGRSSRFGRDKLAVPLGDGTVLERTIAAVQAIAEDVVAVLASDVEASLPAGVRPAHDHEPDGGPLVGVVAGLEIARHPVVLVVGGDMPWLVPAVLRSLVDALESGHDAAALESGGHAQQLPIAVRREPGLAAARVLTAAGGRRLGALVEVLDTAIVPESVWRGLDPDGRSLRDIDVPEDLPGT